MADVFISYSRDNEAVVRGLAEAVVREGYSVWWDEALPPHLSYSDVITGEIDAAKAVIVVWSEKAIPSEWVRAEADLARNQKKLVQTSIDGRMPPMPFNQLHFVSIGDWRGEADHPGWTRVKESLAALCRAEVMQPAHAFPTAAPQRPAPPPVPAGNPALRLVLIVVIGLLLFGAAAAAAFWLLVDRPAAAPPASRPRLSAPATAPPRPAPALPRPATAQPAPAPVRATAPPRPGQKIAAPRRRYCAGPGRNTPQCRQLFRARMSQSR
ncbi:MAG TPA: toll/interleukin-1 receptor domain-containing protein [Allosphingosinicella sp.]|nr:toll/interleukin-1 receptor domain-containing protein [Allosphingosinicella sp.]